MRTQTALLDGTFTAPQTGNTFDMGGEARVAVHVAITAISGAGASATFVLEDSEDGTSWGNVATISGVTATGAIALRGSAPTGQFVRARLSALAGTTPSITCAALARATL